MTAIPFLAPSLVGLILVMGWPASAQEPKGVEASDASPKVVRLAVTHDTWVSDVGSEADGNNGGASRLKFKSIQEMSLIDVDPAPLRGRVLAEATLHLKLVGDVPLRRVTISGV